jgi:hypothetical protein
MNRTARRFWSWLALIAIVFAQLSVSAYACPATAAQAEASVSPCDGGTDAPDANLCDKHCNDHQQSSPAAGALSPFVPSFVSFLARDTGRAISAPRVAALDHSISPPVTVSHCRWRI